MSIASIPPSLGRPPRLRWSGSEFDRAVEMGLFDGRRLELIDGDILETPPMNDPHAQAIQLINVELLAAFPPMHATVRVRCPMHLGESRPFPDFAVIAGTPRQNVSHPTTALLVIEVSESTLDYDREDKARLYARHGIPEYWIINLNDKCVEVHRDPDGVAEYRRRNVYSVAEQLTPLAAPDSTLKVSDLLPSGNE